MIEMAVCRVVVELHVSEIRRKLLHAVSSPCLMTACECRVTCTALQASAAATPA